jgi:hypothetical protein
LFGDIVRVILEVFLVAIAKSKGGWCHDGTGNDYIERERMPA